MADMDPGQQDIRYRVTVDRSDLYQAVSDIESAAQRASQSVSALGSNMLGNIASYSQPGMGLPGNPVQPGMLNAVMASQMSRPMSPQGAFAMDAFQMQAAQMGPSYGAGAAMTTPFGGSVIDPFRVTSQQPFQMPMGFLPQMGPPGAPGDPNRSRLFTGTGEGSLIDQGRMHLEKLMMGGIANDNLEDRMVRNIERRHESFAQNLNALPGMALETGMGFAGGAIGAAMGGVAAPITGILGGIVGSMTGSAINNTVGRMAEPYSDMANQMRQYTAPYVRGNRLGGGSTLSETYDVQRQMGHVVKHDNFLNSDDYKQITSLTGESGVFQMTGSSEQAVKAVEKVGQTFKMLMKLGVKSRDMLSEFDKDMGTFGIDVRNTNQMANFHQTMATAAQSAGMSHDQLTSAIAPAAQMFASQGLGPQAGARIAANNFGVSGEMFRNGSLGAFEKSYYGGMEGYANTLTSGTAQMMRTPMGQAMMMSMTAPGSHTLGQGMQGHGVSIDSMVRNSGSMSPMDFLKNQFLMPRLTQGMGQELETSMMNSQLDQFHQMFGKDKDLGHFIAYQQQANGWDNATAMAKYDQLANAATTGRGQKRSEHDQIEIARIESMRKPTFGRQFNRFIENNLGVPANDIMTSLNKANAQFAAGWEESSTGIHQYDLDEEQRGARENGLGFSAARATGRKRLEEAGFSTARVEDRTSQRAKFEENREAMAGKLLHDDPDAKRRFDEAMDKQGVNPKERAQYFLMATGKTKPTDEQNATFQQVMTRANATETQHMDPEDLASEKGVRKLLANRYTSTIQLDAIRKDSAKKYGISADEVDSYTGIYQQGAGSGTKMPLSADRQAQITQMFDKELTQKQRAFTRDNIDAISGVQSFERNDDGVQEGARREVDFMTKNHGQEAISAAIVLTGDNAREKTMQNLSKLQFGKNYADLSTTQQGRLGATMKQLTWNSGAGGGTKQQAYNQMIDGIGADPGDHDSMNMEESKTKRDESLKYVSSSVGDALKTSGADGTVMTGLVKEMSLDAIFAGAKSSADVIKELGVAGLKGKNLDAVFSEKDRAAFDQDDSGFRTAHHEKIASLTDKLDSSEQRMMKDAAGDIRVNSKRTLMASISEENYRDRLEKVGGELREEDVAGKAGEKGGGFLGTSLGAESMVGTKKLADLVKGFNGKGLSGVEEFAQALQSDPKAQKNIDGTYLKRIQEMTGNVRRGGNLNDDDLKFFAQQGGAKGDEIQAHVESMRKSLADNSETAESLIKKSFTSTVKDGTVSASGAQVTGGTGDKGVADAMAQSVNAQSKIAGDLAKIAEKFNPAGDGGFTKKVDELKTAINGDGSGKSLTKVLEDLIEGGSLKVKVTNQAAAPTAPGGPTLTAQAANSPVKPGG